MYWPKAHSKVLVQNIALYYQLVLVLVLPYIAIGIVAGWHCGTKSVNGCADLDQTYSNQASALTLFNTVMIITWIIMLITLFNTVMIIIFIIVY